MMGGDSGFCPMAALMLAVCMCSCSDFSKRLNMANYCTFSRRTRARSEMTRDETRNVAYKLTVDPRRWLSYCGL
jgi:uncharacterized OsmC-like protein